MFITKQDLKSVPFQILYEKVTLATQKIKFDLQQMELQQYELMLKEKVRMYEELYKTKYVGDIREQYPFEPAETEALVIKARVDIVEEQIKALGLKTKAAWLLPQVSAYIAKMPLAIIEGKVNIMEFLNTNFSADSWHKGLYLYLMHPKRGSLVPTQVAPEYKNYSSLVPLILAPFKRYNAVPYSVWNSPELKYVVDPNLKEAMECEVKLELNAEEILGIRDLGLVVQSGKDAGSSRNPATYHKLYKLQGTPLNDLPWLAQVMCCQIWVAHPVNRTNLMVLDWNNWDNMPEPLITTEIMKPQQKPVALPWDN